MKESSFPVPVFTGNREWRDELSFLTKRGLDRPYLTIMALAVSVNHFEKLEAMLPSNFKLLRADYRKVLAFWQKYVRHVSYSSLPEEVAKWLIVSQCGSLRNSTMYYLQKLYYERILPSRQLAYDIGHGDIPITLKGNFFLYARINGVTLEANMWMPYEYMASRSPSRLYLHLSIRQRYLTEPIAFSLKNFPEPEKIMLGKDDFSYGQQLTYQYSVKDEVLHKYLEAYKRQKYDYYEIRPGFTKEMRASLKRIGLDLEGKGFFLGHPKCFPETQDRFE